MKSVTQKMANDCINAYNAQLPKAKGKITTGVGFNTTELASWLQKVSPRAFEIQVRFGIYSEMYSPDKESTGRMTVFFFACDEAGNTATDEEGNTILPVNAGVPYP